MRRLTVIIALLMVAVLAAPLSAGAGDRGDFPDEIDLPDGFFPEGIDIGRGTTFYVGSLADGSIYRGDLRTGEGSVLTAPFDFFGTVGIEIDRHNRIWAAGGPTGTGRVYDARTGALLATYEFTAPFASFINDVVVTQDAAYFTDSGTTNNPDPNQFVFAGEPRLFVVPIGHRGALPGPTGFSELPVGVPDITFPNLNGIETLPSSDDLVVGSTSAESLYRIDKSDGSASVIDVGVALPGNDGLTRRGRMLYVVQNGIAQVAEINLDRTGGSVAQVYPVPGAETPTTVALLGNAMYLPDARFFTMTGPYKIYRVELN